MSDGSYMRDHMLAMDIIKAIAMFDWGFMLKQFPEGVVINECKYNQPDHFLHWQTDMGYGIYKARDSMVNLCANKAWTLLNNLYG